MIRAKLLSLSALTFGTLITVAGEARAGGCLTCTTNAECSIVSQDAVCVRYDSDVGCGADRQLCCPGQGCALDNDGVPSCLGVNCELVEAPDAGQPPADGGMTDASGPIPDGGTSTTTPDAGTSTRSPGNFSAGAARDRPGSCGCTAAGGETGAAYAGLLLLLLFGVGSRRR